MSFSTLCRQALMNLTSAKLRSFLAVLGILVGTAAVVALLSCGQLATEKALEQFKALGTNLLAVAVYQKPPANTTGGSAALNSLSVAQWQELPTHIPYIKNLASYSTAYQPLSFHGKVMQGVIIGADEHLAEIVKIKLARGNFVSFLDTFEHYCVIGAGLAQQMQQISYADPIGQQLRIGQALYTIIGVAQQWHESGFFNEDINQAAIIPIAGISLINKDAKINNAVLELKPDSPIDDVIEQIKTLITTFSPKLSIFARSAKQIIASMENQGHIFTLLLAVIGSISLLVGGIGVMNVMLVSVSERKKEIGIRKAVGARNRDIQALFLVESVMLSLVGGFIGVLIGITLTWVIAYFSHWNFTLLLLPPLAGFMVSAATGIFFGFYPAYRASRLEPVTCLRSE